MNYISDADAVAMNFNAPCNALISENIPNGNVCTTAAIFRHNPARMCEECPGLREAKRHKSKP